VNNLSSNSHPVNIPLGSENKIVSEGFLLSTVVSSFPSVVDVSEPGRVCDTRAETPGRYWIEKSDPCINFRYKLWDECDELRSERNRPYNIAKRRLKDKVLGRRGLKRGEGLSYLEYNAQTLGDFEGKKYNSEIRDLKYAENVINQCGKSVVWFEGERTGGRYVKKLDCRKQWCPDCGGRNGKIHKKRLHSIQSRVNLEKYSIRQFVLTVPADLRELVKSREKLTWLTGEAKRIIAKFFGIPQFDKHGHVKRYNLEKGAIEYLHIFGDEEAGVFKPHFNVHIFEEIGVKLKLDESVLNSIKSAWLKVLRVLKADLSAVDVHYSFSTGVKKNMHRVKYMSRPWSVEDYAAIVDDSLKELLLLDLSGFQYMRFWGAMANCRYRDEMELSEVVESCGNKAGERLIPLFVAPFDFGAWAYCLEELDDGFYRIVKKGNEDIAFLESKRARMSE
jgi:hypothetical protein